MPLITNHNHKMNKSNNYANERDQNRLFSGLSLAAGNTSGYEVCPSRTDICSELCIGPFSGRGQMKSVQKARIDKTKYFIEERKALETSEPYLFLTSKAQKIYPSLVYDIVKNYLSKVTTMKKRSPHVLRHTFATHLLNEGANLQSIKELLGHASLATTQVYTHTSLEKLKDVYNQAHPRSKK